MESAEKATTTRTKIRECTCARTRTCTEKIVQLAPQIAPGCTQKLQTPACTPLGLEQFGLDTRSSSLKWDSTITWRSMCWKAPKPGLKVEADWASVYSQTNYKLFSSRVAGSAEAAGPVPVLCKASNLKNSSSNSGGLLI